MNIYEEIRQERERQLAWGSDDFDKRNTRNDWIAYITSYAGDAADKVAKKSSRIPSEENARFRNNMIKVAALAVAALDAYSKGHC